MLGLAAIQVPVSERVSELHLLEYLTPNERTHYDRSWNGELRRQGISGRLAAKHLLLSELGQPGPSSGQQALHWIDIDALEEFPKWAYHEIEILRPRSAHNGSPVVKWAGRAHSIHISLTHTPKFAAACLDQLGLVGVDIEVPRRREAAFYRVNFSPKERLWAETVSEAAAVDEDWPYTLLWCLKESVLKAQASREISLWRLPRIEVEPRFNLELLVASLRSRSVTEALLVGEVEVCYNEHARMGKAVLAVTPNAVLTALKLQPQKKERW